jgi:DNA invertase Pin-like site-specific DNA recombinase
MSLEATLDSGVDAMTSKANSKEPPTMPRRAYSYTRFSTMSQLDGDSERRQAEWAAVVSEQQGWTLDDTLVFVDRGRSGFHRKNLEPTAALSQFLSLIGRRIAPGSVLIVENIDRLSRADVDTAHDLFRSIIRAGIWICTRTPFRIYKGDKEASFMDLLEPIWIMYCAYMESLKKQMRGQEVWKTRREAAREGKASHFRPPCWLTRTDNGWDYIPDKLALLRRIVDLTVNGMSAGEVVDLMVSERQPPLGWKGKTWHRSTLQYLLRSRTLLGEYQPHVKVDGQLVPDGKPIPGFYKPVLEPDEFLALQAAVAGRRRARGRRSKGEPNLFTGLLWDAATRAKLSMSGLKKAPHNKGHRYLVVPAFPHSLTIRYDEFEQAVLATLAMLRPEDVLDPKVKKDEREKRIAALTARVTALTHRQERLQAAAADPDQDEDAILPVLAQVTRELKTTANERDTLQLETTSGRAEALAESQTLWQLRASAAGEEREELNRRIRAALPSVVSSIWCQGQDLGKRKRIVHVQIFLRGGSCRYVQVLPVPHANQTAVDLAGVDVWQMGNHDLRKGAFVPD